LGNNAGYRDKSYLDLVFNIPATIEFNPNSIVRDFENEAFLKTPMLREKM
jgi:hypothetical protein